MTSLSWSSKEAKEPLATFLTRYPPSKTHAPAGGDGWIWVKGRDGRAIEGEDGSSKSVADAQAALDGLVKRYAEIESNPKIPRVKSKTSGPSKKTMKDSAAKQTEEALRELGKQWPCGKWLLFEREAYVDRVFSTLAKSLVDGPLSKLKEANCHTIKVATADGAAKPSSSSHRKEPTSLICLYFDAVWNADHAKEVLECIVQEHGVIPNSAKADLYTIIGLDSNHPSKLRSTLFRPSELVNDEVLKEWQSTYRSRPKRKADDDQSATGARIGSSTKSMRVGGGPIKPEEYWPAARDDEGEDEFEEMAMPTPNKKQAGRSSREPEKPAPEARVSPPADKAIDSDSETEEEEDIIELSISAKNSTSSTSAHSPPQAEEMKNDPKTVSPSATRQTILPAPSTFAKKRDRFGRSDF